jgi:hypothetical protein
VWQLPKEIPDPENFGWQRLNGTVSYFPAPEEIRAACKAIQARWSLQESQRRRTAMPYDTAPPVDRIDTPPVSTDAA